jgi:hypothetical protein
MSGKAYANDFAVCGLPLGHHFQFSSKKRTPKLDRLRLCKPDPGIRASLMQLRTALPSARVDQQVIPGILASLFHPQECIPFCLRLSLILVNISF